MYELEYNGEKISYKIISLNIKNMYIYIKEGKVTVKAPINLKEKDIIDFIDKKKKWIYNKIKEQNNIENRNIVINNKDIERLENVIEYSIKEYSKKLGVFPNKVRIRDIKYAWGSCSINKNITINKKLAIKEENVIKYVVLHEMCHLKYMNHSKSFWDLVESAMPDYKIYKKKLKG